MKLTIFGANGAIGQHLVTLALTAGHDVTAYVRRQNTLRMSHENLNIIVGSLTNVNQLKKAIQESDVVMSALGPALSMKRQVTGLPIAEAHKAIMTAMEQTGRKRFITLATPTIGAKEDVKQLVTTLPSKMAKVLYPTGYAEMKAIEELIKKSSLDWTVVRIINPNVKTDGQGYAITLGDAKGKMGVSRLNAAKCMLDAASKDEWIVKMPIVFNK
ncbi:oxidoreductase [Domibacillus antri]|uniref:Oxidoreductase n=1 Tax=Domibacillus antri TaxID=1714264 RepID=A0A1Q8Q8P2_9BACI|nr:NAD(P)H-binding protein [Domibacillus antri]OLN23671.1 oxidoreductase [Domibacillus antri]